MLVEHPHANYGNGRHAKSVPDGKEDVPQIKDSSNMACPEKSNSSKTIITAKTNKPTNNRKEKPKKLENNKELVTSETMQTLQLL